jgi:hypothetical protein
MSDHIPMTIRDAASIPLSLSSLTFNYWWHNIIDGIPAVMGWFLPVAGGILVVLQIAYYWKMIRGQ